MTRIGVIIGLYLAMAACTPSRKEETPRNPSFSDEGVGAQQRIGRYLQESVVATKLRTCWGRLRGKGAVATDLTYRKSGNNWAFENVKVTKSTLPPDQGATAQRCIEESARATTFPVDSKQDLEMAAQQFIVRLGWSVPLPAEGTQMTSDQMARMVRAAV